VHAKVAVELQAMWKQELGIEMELRQMEKKVYLAAQTVLDYDLSRSSWVGDYNDPTTFLDLFLGSNGNNRTGWSHPRYEELMKRAGSESNVEQRARILSEAETLLVRDEVPIIPLYFYLGFQFYDPDKVEGIYGNILGMNPIRTLRKRASVVGGR
jgi:oligopeptide transport system substrate-binding protein